MPLIPGDIIHVRYRVDDLLAQGGMSAVYRAWDLRLHVACALKEMVPYPGMDQRALAQLRDQFLQEAQVLAELRHPNMPRVTDHFEYEGGAYLVMDFVEGQRLDEIIEDQGKIPVSILTGWARGLVDALYYCHQQGVLHRDVKPQNVIITPERNVMLVDFGLAKLLDIEDRRTRTVMRGLGTPEYAPPEQYDAEPGSTDERSDIYALGATLYHALAGTPPPTATQRIVDPGLLKPVRHYTRDVPAHIDDALLKSLSLQPSERFGSVPEMAGALFGESIIRPSSQPLRNGKKPRLDPLATVMLSRFRRVPPVQILAGMAGIAVIVVMVFVLWRNGLSAGASLIDTATPTQQTTQVTSAITPSPQATLTPAPSATATATMRPSPTGTATPIVTLTPLPTSTPTMTALPSDTPVPSATPCVYSAALVTIREPRGRGTWWLPFSPARFDIELRNNGDCAWPEGTQLVLVSDNAYNWPETWDLGALAVDGTIQVEITLRSPSEEGVYPSVWQVELPDGLRIGPEITYDLRVESPTPTATRLPPTLTPTGTRSNIAPTSTNTPVPTGTTIPTITPRPTDTPVPTNTPREPPP
jgi:serine/threonine protein kinase